MKSDYNKIFRGKRILITGGSGFLGNALIARLLEYKPKEIRIFSRDESLQEKTKKKFPNEIYILGDVRDYNSIKFAMSGVDIVVHAAAVKYLDWAEEQPTDCIKTNILGSMNVIQACLENDVNICVGCSTDKAPYARNVYGCSKQIMEALFREANKYNKTKFLLTRYGNVVGSTGSVIPKWIDAVIYAEPLVVTDKRMRRFFMSVDHAVDCVFSAIKTKKNFFPTDLKAINIWRLAKIIARGRVEVIEGKIRSGEKLDETLIADYEGQEFSTKNAREFTDEEIKDLIF